MRRTQALYSDKALDASYYSRYIAVMVSNALSTVAVNVKKLRKGKGLTQVALAERTGLSVATIYFIEQDRRPNPSFPTLRKLASALDVNIGAITG